MRSISSNAPVCARWLQLTFAALVVAGCGAGPDPSAAVAGSPAAPAAPAAPDAPATTAAAVQPVRVFACTSLRRGNYAKVLVDGSLRGSTPSHVTATVPSTGATLADSAAPTDDPAYGGGGWPSLGLEPWALGGNAASFHLLLPPSVATAFNGLLIGDYPSGARVSLQLVCAASIPVTPPTFGVPAGPAVRTLSCTSPGVAATEASTVSGRLDAASLPRDVVVTSTATGTMQIAAPAPTYTPSFDNGAWAAGSGLYAWSLGARAGATYTLLLPGLPNPASFDAVLVADLGASGRLETTLACTAR